MLSIKFKENFCTSRLFFLPRTNSAHASSRFSKETIFSNNFVFCPPRRINFKLLWPPPSLIPLLHKVKDLYLLWYQYYQLLPKTHRYTLGQKIDSLLVETIEAIAFAAFLKPEEKAPYVRLAIRKTDTLKILLMILWETKSLDNKKYLSLSENLDSIGKNLGGWHGSLLKKNSPGK